jgi:hypothetical protein
MNRLIAALVIGLAAVVVGCGDKDKEASPPTKPMPSASDMFDKKEMPQKPGKPAGKTAAPG